VQKITEYLLSATLASVQLKICWIGLPFCDYCFSAK